MEPEWNIAYENHDAVILGLQHSHSMKEKIKAYVDTVGWSLVLQSLVELSNNIPAYDPGSIFRKNQFIHALHLAYESYTNGQTK